jgi:hypothetical protein
VNAHLANSFTEPLTLELDDLECWFSSSPGNIPAFAE